MNNRFREKKYHWEKYMELRNRYRNRVLWLHPQPQTIRLLKEIAFVCADRQYIHISGWLILPAIVNFVHQFFLLCSETCWKQRLSLSFLKTRISCNLSDWMVNYGSTVVLAGMTSALKGKEVIGFPNSKLHLTSVSCQISLTLTPWVPGRLTVHAFIFGKALKLWQALITKVARENVFNKCMLTFLKVQISSSEGYYPKL